MASAASRAPSPLRSTIATREPSAASASASARPRLRAPPVTSATFPAMPRSIAISVGGGLDGPLRDLPREGNAPAEPALETASSGHGGMAPFPDRLLVPFEHGLALLEERLDAFGRVLRRERFEERARLGFEAAVDVRVQPVIGRLDDEARGDGRALGDQPGHRLRIVERLALLGEPVDEPEGEALLGGN